MAVNIFNNVNNFLSQYTDTTHLYFHNVYITIDYTQRNTHYQNEITLRFIDTNPQQYTYDDLSSKLDYVFSATGYSYVENTNTTDFSRSDCFTLNDIRYNSSTHRLYIDYKAFMTYGDGNGEDSYSISDNESAMFITTNNTFDFSDTIFEITENSTLFSRLYGYGNYVVNSTSHNDTSNSVYYKEKIVVNPSTLITYRTLYNLTGYDIYIGLVEFDENGDVINITYNHDDTNIFELTSDTHYISYYIRSPDNIGSDSNYSYFESNIGVNFDFAIEIANTETYSSFIDFNKIYDDMFGKPESSIMYDIHQTFWFVIIMFIAVFVISIPFRFIRR